MSLFPPLQEKDLWEDVSLEHREARWRLQLLAILVLLGTEGRQDSEPSASHSVTYTVLQEPNSRAVVEHSFALCEDVCTVTGLIKR